MASGWWCSRWSTWWDGKGGAPDMTTDTRNESAEMSSADEHGPIEMPRPTAWPMVVALGIGFGLAGVATSPAILLVGAVILMVGLAGWVGQLLPGHGHVHEERAAPDERPRPVAARPGTVRQLVAGVP